MRSAVWFLLGLALGCGPAPERHEVQPEFPLGVMRFETPDGFANVHRFVDPEFGIVCYEIHADAFSCVKLPEPIVQKSAVRQ